MDIEISVNISNNYPIVVTELLNYLVPRDWHKKVYSYRYSVIKVFVQIRQLAKTNVYFKIFQRHFVHDFSRWILLSFSFVFRVFRSPLRWNLYLREIVTSRKVNDAVSLSKDRKSLPSVVRWVKIQFRVTRLRNLSSGSSVLHAVEKFFYSVWAMQPFLNSFMNISLFNDTYWLLKHSRV